MSQAIRTLFLVVSLFFASCAAYAQFDVGSLVGTIRDQSGAAVPNASITVTNAATNIQSSATSNNNGDYEVPSLRAGVYTISAKAPNYAEAVAENITISVGNRQRIDLELKVGQAQT
ncbi:MAG TPA: carboxypeptidase-like regulatory domain-containing protein, partial [Acidobacteriaceae bacterium]|nr:carboxypeptidase-like regulatory domain-containing protein [Acidobacteriaceae bacterium]